MTEKTMDNRFARRSAGAGDFLEGNRMDNNEHGTNLASLGTDAISRQAAIDAVMECYDNDELFEVYEWKLNELPPIQPEITHEQAIDYLHSTGWMQEHDRQMMLDGVHRLTAQPEPHWIPVTKPPTDRMICYVTLKDTKDENRQNWVAEMIYTPWDGLDLMDGIEAIAWMPKQYPEPYKGVTE